MTWGIIVGFAIFAAILFVALVAAIWSKWDEFLRQLAPHLVSITGLAGMGVAALFLVAGFENVYGPIKFSGPGFNFEGASGPLVLWVIAFLSMVGGARLVAKAFPPVGGA